MIGQNCKIYICWFFLFTLKLKINIKKKQILKFLPVLFLITKVKQYRTKHQFLYALKAYTRLLCNQKFMVDADIGFYQWQEL